MRRRPSFKTVAQFGFITAWTDLLIPTTMSRRTEGWRLAAGVVQMQTGFNIYRGVRQSPERCGRKLSVAPTGMHRARL
jgi:ABC-type glycerol-3-phosphate transport system permease component